MARDLDSRVVAFDLAVIKGARSEFAVGRVTCAQTEIGIDDVVHDDHRAVAGDFHHVLPGHGMGVRITKKHDVIQDGAVLGERPVAQLGFAVKAQGLAQKLFGDRKGPISGNADEGEGAF